MVTEHVEVGGLYFVALALPSFLNDSSPVEPIPPNVAHWRTSDARLQTANVRSIRRHIGLVIRVDSMMKVAVILLGTSRPAHPHRYLPWHGTAHYHHANTEEVFFQTPWVPELYLCNSSRDSEVEIKFRIGAF